MIHASSITKRFGQKILYQNGSFQINRGEKIGLVGPNGSGKTTILRILAKEDVVDEGSVTIPEKIVVGYFSQNLEDMAGNTVLAEVKSAHPRYKIVQSELARFEAMFSEPMSDDEIADECSLNRR